MARSSAACGIYRDASQGGRATDAADATSARVRSRLPAGGNEHAGSGHAAGRNPRAQSAQGSAHRGGVGGRHAGARQRRRSHRLPVAPRRRRVHGASGPDEGCKRLHLRGEPEVRAYPALGPGLRDERPGQARHLRAFVRRGGEGFRTTRRRRSRLPSDGPKPRRGTRVPTRRRGRPRRS